MNQRVKPKLGGAVYLLPNVLTTGNLFFGFFSIVKSLQGDLQYASSAILLAAIFDVLDGRVARLTNSSSEFGVQYDSLCDMVSFGLAPAFLMYQGGLNTLGRIGWIVCFVFLACGALRLARFNVQSSIGKASGDFTGLPIPMAAGVVACFMAMSIDMSKQSFPVDWMNVLASWLADELVRVLFLCIAGAILALCMVSNITFRSHKTLIIKGVKPFRLLVLLVVLVALVAFQPELFGFLFFFLYAISGPIEWIFGWKRAISDEEIFEETYDEDQHV